MSGSLISKREVSIVKEKNRDTMSRNENDTRNLNYYRYDISRRIGGRGSRTEIEKENKKWTGENQKKIKKLKREKLEIRGDSAQ